VGRALHHSEEAPPAVFARHDVAAVIDALSTEETADYIGAMLFALQGMAAAKDLTVLVRLLEASRTEANRFRQAVRE
jgi:hypothetical protein